MCINKVNTWLSSLLRDRGPDLYRSKGILAVEGSDHKFVFQGVHSLLTMTSSEEGIESFVDNYEESLKEAAEDAEFAINMRAVLDITMQTCQELTRLMQ